jgi:acetyl-CoA carboxylase biotin carboxyl carrier protein
MELDNIVKLIKTVSDSSITNFVLEEGNVKLVLEKNAVNNVVSVSTETVPQVIQNQSVPAQSSQAADEKIIKSILVGVFYCAPGPEEAPFVKVGDTVKKGQNIGIIEAMKLMNEIECEYDGVVEEVLVEDGDMVEYGQPLFRIKKV